MGIDPGRRSLRELVLMLKSKTDYDWQHTSSLMALLANCHRDPKKRREPFTPQDFQPKAKAIPKETTSDLSILKSVFVEG